MENINCRKKETNNDGKGEVRRTRRSISNHFIALQCCAVVIIRWHCPFPDLYTCYSALTWAILWKVKYVHRTKHEVQNHLYYRQAFHNFVVDALDIFPQTPATCMINHHI